MDRSEAFPVGAGVTLEQLADDPHPVLARLREREPVSWTPVLGGWLVTRRDLVQSMMRDADRFTVEDPRFSTARVIGPSMLSLDGEKHRRHRAPFVDPFRPRAVRDRFACSIRAEAERLIDSWAPARSAELRRSFAGPVSAAIVAQALGLHAAETPKVRAWYESIVSGVTAITAGEDVPSLAREAFSALSSRLGRAIDGGAEGSVLGAAANSGLDRAQVISNAAVLLFGGVETTEGMIANAALHLLERPAHLDAVRADERLLAVAIEESLRLEPPAAVVDRYATEDIEVAGARIARGELVRLSISAANRDPGAFANPDELDLSGANGRRHLAFAHGPHVCLGIHLARLEARTALATLLRRVPGLRLDPARPSRITGLVFRKPRDLRVVWE